MSQLHRLVLLSTCSLRKTCLRYRDKLLRLVLPDSEIAFMKAGVYRLCRAAAPVSPPDARDLLL